MSDPVRRQAECHFERRRGWLLGLVLGLAVAPCSASAPELDLSQATIADLQRAMLSGVPTSERLTSPYLARIEAY